MLVFSELQPKYKPLGIKTRKQKCKGKTVINRPLVLSRQEDGCLPLPGIDLGDGIKKET